MIYIITGKTGHGKTATLTKKGRQCLQNNERVFPNYKLYPEKMWKMKKFVKIFGELPEIREEEFELLTAEGTITIKTTFTQFEGRADKREDRENPKIKILYWQNFSDWQYFTGGTVLCTEGIKYFNARKWESLPQSMTDKFVEHRKDKIDCYFDVQHYTFIDKQLRILCENFVNCELKLGSANFDTSIMPRVTKLVGIDLPTLNRCENLGIDPYDVRDEEAEKYNVKILFSEFFWIKKKIFSWYDTAQKILPSKPEDLIHQTRTCPECGYTKTTHA